MHKMKNLFKYAILSLLIVILPGFIVYAYYTNNTYASVNSSSNTLLNQSYNSTITVRNSTNSAPNSTVATNLTNGTALTQTSGLCYGLNETISRYYKNNMVYIENNFSGNLYSELNSTVPISTPQLQNLINSSKCSIAPAAQNVMIEDYNLTIPYGYLSNKGRDVGAGTSSHYAIYIQNGSILRLYNISITKAVPNLEVKLGRVIINSSEPVENVLVSPYKTFGSAVYLTNSYNLNASLSSSISGNTGINYSYKIYVGGVLKDGGNISAISINKLVSFSNIPSTESSEIVFETKGNSNYSAVDPTVYYTTANTNLVISSSTILGSDLVCGSLTINSGITLTTDGYDILCSNSVINNGVISTGHSPNGGAGSGGAGGSYTSSYAGSGGGGGGGGGGGVPGSPGSTPTLPSITGSLIQTWYGGPFVNYDSGAGGGGGGDGSGDLGGDGAYGIYIQANSITTGTIQALGSGGAGTTATAATTGGTGGATAGTAGGSGGRGGGKHSSSGGGGAGGGFVLLAYNGVGTAPSTSGITVSGGTGGSSGSAGVGGNGGNGQIYVFNYGTSPPILVLPPIPSVSLSTCPSTTVMQSGQSVSCTATVSTGTGPYTYNWIVSNSITDAVTANMLFTGVSATSNTFTYTTTSADVANSPEQFNVIVTDSSPTTFNSIYSSTFGISQGLTTPTISPSDPAIDSGQSVTFSSTWLGGTSTYGASLYSSSTSTCNQQSTLVEQEIGLSSTSATFSSVSPASNTYYCIFVTENNIYSPSIGSTLSDTEDVRQLAFSPSGTFAYVTDPLGNNVVILNTATNAVTGAITAGFNSPEGVSIAPSGTYAYVVNTGAPTNIVIINTATNAVTGAITTGLNLPYSVAFSPDGSYAYVANYNSGTVSIIDTATNSVTASISSGFSSPTSVSFSPSGTFAYASNNGNFNVAIINTATNAVTGSITTVSFDPTGVSIAPSGTYAYVTSVSSNTYLIDVIDTATNTITQAYSSSAVKDPQYVGISPDGSYAYVLECTLINPLTKLCSTYYLGIVQTNVQTTNSINSEVTVNPALSVPILISSPVLPASLGSGNTITFTASWTGGTPTYTANYLIVNTVTGNLVANMLFTGISGTSNSFAWTIPSADLGNTVQTNVIVTDSAYSPETTNSIKSGTLTIVSGSNTCSFTTSNSVINFGLINPGNVIATQNAILITNTGNTPSNVLLSGNSWAFGTNTFGVTNTVWSWSINVPYITANALTSTEYDTEVTLGASNSKDIYFGIGIPAGEAPGTYSQTINIISSC